MSGMIVKWMLELFQLQISSALMDIFQLMLPEMMFCNDAIIHINNTNWIFQYNIKLRSWINIMESVVIINDQTAGNSVY